MPEKKPDTRDPAEIRPCPRKDCKGTLHATRFDDRVEWHCDECGDQATEDPTAPVKASPAAAKAKPASTTPVVDG